jgi:hypothetical protein
MVRGRDLNMIDALSRQRSWCNPEPFDRFVGVIVLY